MLPGYCWQARWRLYRCVRELRRRIPMRLFDSNYTGEKMCHIRHAKMHNQNDHYPQQLFKTAADEIFHSPARPVPYKVWNLQLADLESVFNYYVRRLKILFVEANKTCLRAMTWISHSFDHTYI